MQDAPDVNWGLAVRVGSVGSRDLPDLKRAQLGQLVADLRVRSRLAGEIAGDFLGLPGAKGAGEIRVVDWAGWARAASAMVDTSLSEVGLVRRPKGPLTGLRSTGNALLAGVALRFASRRLLGQYDAYSGKDILYLVAPSIVVHEDRFGFVPTDFRLWVALHEQTHALQFRLAPWLRDQIRASARIVLDGDVSVPKGIAEWVRDGDLGVLLLGGGAAEELSKLSATMSFLEGHADFVADNAGRDHIGTVAQLRRSFSRTETSPLARVLPSFDKTGQYRDGLAFCRRVAAKAGPEALLAAFSSPGELPSLAEIAAPADWIARVHG